MHANGHVDGHFRHLISVLRPARGAKKGTHRQMSRLLNGGGVGDPLQADRHQSHLAMNLSQSISNCNELRALTIAQLDQQFRHQALDQVVL